MERLEWGISPRFADYVRNTGDGRVLLAGGSSELPDGTFVFPLGSMRRLAHETAFLFTGSVRFVGHGGALDLSIVDPRVVVSGDTCAVWIADPEEGGQFDFARGHVVERAASTSAELTLTEDGSSLFFYRYPAGSALEPMEWWSSREPAAEVQDDGRRRS